MASPLRRETREIARLALPVVLTQVGTMLMATVDVMMLGRVGAGAIGAAALGGVWTTGTLIVFHGVVLGIDPLISQAYGARDAEGMAGAFQRGLVLSVVLTVPCTLLWLGTERVLLLAAQDPALARDAGRYAIANVPGILPFLLFQSTRSWLQCRRIMAPALWVTLAANLVNVLGNWVLIYGNLGFPALGVVGAGLSTSLVRVALALGLWAWVARFRLHEGAWQPWSRAVLEPAGLRRVAALGLPVGLHIGLEMWAFAVATLMAGMLDDEEQLAAHQIVLNISSLSFMVPLGISMGAVTRVGNLLGARDHEGAQRAAWTSFALGGLAMVLAAALFVGFRAELARFYTDEAPVVAVCATILPIAAGFQVFDGLQVVGCGVLRGMGRTRPAAIFNFIGYYLLALPLASWLTFDRGLGVRGIWYGLWIGLASVAVMLILWIARRGPRHLAPRPSTERDRARAG